MNNILNQGTGGAFIKLPGRPSIHSHRGCVFAEGERMVRYGIHSNNNKENGAPNEQGADEVDNILSKPSRPITTPRQKKNYRRNSLEALNTSSDYDNNVLSNSVPATLPSQLYYSVSDEEQEDVIQSRYSDVSYHSVGSANKSNASRNISFSTAQRLDPVRTYDTDNLEKDGQNQSRVLYYVVGVIVVVCAVIYSSGFSVGHMSNINKSTYDQCRFNTDISGLGEKYNIDENSILQVQTGISVISEKHDTGSFMFVYNSEAANFVQSEFNEFINDISLAASKYLRNDSTLVRYTTVEGAKLDMEEHSELLCRYRAELAATGVMLVRHLEAVPGDLAMAFHYYCDEYNPLVKKTAIFFTLNMAKCSKGPGKKSTHSLIEKCLAEKWKAVPADSIGPLLARVVSVVIDVTSVF